MNLNSVEQGEGKSKRQRKKAQYERKIDIKGEKERHRTREKIHRMKVRNTQNGRKEDIE